MQDEANKRPAALALELTCPICLQLFSDPVSLPCGHVFCLRCLKTMGEGLDQHSCPECQTEYQGTTALAKSFKMCSIVETYKASSGATGATGATGAGCTALPHEVRHMRVERDVRCMRENPNTYNEDSLTPGNHLGPGTGSLGRHISFEGDGSKGKKEMDEPKFKLASQVTELSLKLEVAESALKKEKESEAEVTNANSLLRGNVSKLLDQIQELSRCFSAQVMQLLEDELGPGEASLRSRVSGASALTQQLRRAMLQAESLLTEDDERTFADEFRTLQPHIVELMAKPVGEEEESGHVESKINPARACTSLEKMSTELREGVAQIQRSLRNTLNPSEVTFDPETAHPNLILSPDLKTVTFSAAKQPYASSPQRFTSFFQVLSSQSFSEGDHSWEVELEGSPWIIGVCYSSQLVRSGLASALESSRGSWCLMWFNNLLTAFEQSHDVPLKKTTVSRRLEIRLSFKTHRLSFYNISSVSGKSHIYTFKANLSEPVHLAYRMMSGHPTARVTIYS